MTGFFQKRGKAAIPLSGSRISADHNRLWVDFGMAAFGNATAMRQSYIQALNQVLLCYTDVMSGRGDDYAKSEFEAAN